MTRKIKCAWCGEYFTVERNKKNNAVKYCSPACRKEARRQTIRVSTDKWRKHSRQYAEHGYLLGDSRLSEKPCKTFEQEQRAIRKEKRRLGI